MPNIQKRPYSDVADVYGDIGDPRTVGGGQDAAPRSNLAAPDRAKAVSAVPEGGPADLNFLLHLSDTCMHKDVRAAVQKAAACGKAAGSACPFLGVRRKQRYSHQILKLEMPIVGVSARTSALMVLDWQLQCCVAQVNPAVHS